MYSSLETVKGAGWPWPYLDYINLLLKKGGGALFKDIGNFKVKIFFSLYSMVVYTQMNQFEKCEVDLWLVS